MVKKQTKSKKTVAEDPTKVETTSSEENLENGNPSQVQENGQEVSLAKKKPTPKKARGTKSAKPSTEPERKSSRAPKPIKKEGDENQAYEVEKIVDMRVAGQTEYKVRWRGYSKADDTWEKETALTSCQGLLQEFKLLQNASGPKKSNSKKRTASKSPSKTPAKKKTKTAKKVEKDYEVEEIVGMREKNGKKEFKIRWKGFKASDDSWEPEKNLSCQDLINNYMEKNQDKTEEEDLKEEDVKEEDDAETANKKTTRTKATPKGKVKKSKKTK